MRYCLIGCGRVSPEHIRAARGNGLEIAGLCDISPESLAGNLGREQLDDVPVYENYKDLLRGAKPELCAIATPSGYHAQMALDCLEAGAHVIVEKPIAMNLADARAIRELAKRRGLTVCNNLQNRFNPAVQALRKAVEVGRFGHLYSASMQLRWHRGDDYYRSAAWRGTRALDGGCMMNQGIHGIDLVNWMLGGRPKRVTALTATVARGIECEDLGLALVEYPGALASIECTTLRHPAAEEEVLEFSGERGVARLGGTAGHVVETWRFDGAPADEEAVMRRLHGANPESVYGHGHSLLYADVLRAIAEKRPPLSDAVAGTGALGIILGAYESARTGRAVELQTCY
ncbi:MAG: Gfo/Idh/MocA family oxidoreductase [Oscillospiraceae bacterium]|jgi:predicted dehydrogenase|nr:Gfo/Idh/MocA family oxidoreductase [Oscillospiraceae bacterium]